MHDGIRQEQQITWIQLLTLITHKTIPSRFRKLVRDLNNKNKYTDATYTHEAITTRIATGSLHIKQQSNILNKHYAYISRLPHHPTDRRLDRLQRRLGNPPALTPTHLHPKHDHISSWPNHTHLRLRWLHTQVLETYWASSHHCLDRQFQSLHTAQHHTSRLEVR